MLATLLTLGVVTVTIPEAAEVKGLEIRVGSIATCAGDDALEVERVLATSLGYAPSPGYHRILRADLVRIDLQRALPDVQIEVAGAQRCKVVPVVESLDAERLWSVASAELEKIFRGTDASLKRGGELASLDVPLGEGPAELRAILVDTGVDAGPRSVAVQVWIDGDIYRTVHVPFQVALREPRWVLKRPVQAGQVLDPSLFELRRIEVTFNAGLHGLSAEALAGTIAARPLAADMVVTERDIQRPVVIRKGELVTVVVRSGPIEVRDMAIASADGRIGEMLRVSLSSTRREISGRVTGAAHVEVTIK